MVHKGNPHTRLHNGRPYARMKAQLKREGSHVCWLCGQAINMMLHYNDRMSWTLDHVLPASRYPDQLLDMSNAREAHRACNSARGIRDPFDGGGTVGVTRSW